METTHVKKNISVFLANPSPTKKSSLRNLLYSFLRDKNIRVSSHINGNLATKNHLRVISFTPFSAAKTFVYKKILQLSLKDCEYGQFE